jgi:hypothetical protein
MIRDPAGTYYDEDGSMFDSMKEAGEFFIAREKAQREARREAALAEKTDAIK